MNPTDKTLTAAPTLRDAAEAALNQQPSETVSRKAVTTKAVSNHTVTNEAETNQTETRETATSETQRLLHDVHVHQIELEMQNESMRQVQAELETSRDLYADLYEFAPVGYVTLSPQGAIEKLNLTAVALLGKERKLLIKRNFLNLVSEADQPRWVRFFAHLNTQDNNGTLELSLRRSDNTALHLRVDCVWQASAVQVALTDITAHKQAELAFAHQAELLNLTGKLAKVGGWEVNLQTMKLTWTQETFRIAEIETGVEPVLEEGINLFAPEARPIIAAAVQATIETGEPYDLELPLITAKGRYIWVKTQGFAEIQQGKAVRIYGTFQDVTASRQVNVALTAAVQEKTVLLKEVHHRVKNNLQVITSLLRLEATRSHDFATKTVLKDMQGRIRSMALLHETLYRSGIFAGVDLGLCLKQLASEAFRAAAGSTSAVSLELELSSVHVEMDQALPCGLLVNELLSNSVKHGFPNGGKGVIKVELKRIEALVHLSVSDTGIGLATDFNLSQQTSLGLHLVADLAQQLGGELQIKTGQGASLTGAAFTVVFTPKT